MNDYNRGWEDCRCYCGEATDESAEYRDGFNACLRAYHAGLVTGRGWDGVAKRGTVDGGINGRDTPLYKGGKVKFASFNRDEAEKKVDAWSTLKVEVIENIEAEIAKRMSKLDPVDFLLLEKGFRERWFEPPRSRK